MTEKQQALFKTWQERNRVWELAHLYNILHHTEYWPRENARKWWERHRN